MSKQKKPIKVRSLNIWLLVLGVISFVAIILELRSVYRKYENLLFESENYVFVQKDLQDLKSSFDSLTEYSRQYILTLDESALLLYFQEKSLMQKKDAILADLRERMGGTDTTASLLVENAYNFAVPRLERELHALRLVIGENRMSPELAAYSLSAEELSMSEHELEDASYDLLFSHEYAAVSKSVDEQLTMAVKTVFLHFHQRRFNSRRIFYITIIRQLVLSVFLLLLIVITSILIALIVIRPLNIYIECIRNSSPLKDVAAGAELKYLADTYNTMYQMNKTSREELQRQASYDAVTGLLNRISFEQLCAFYKGVSESVALLIVDLDNFKHINDGYGHEIGDIALKHTATLLKNMAGKNDRAFRIGGDEFALILTDVSEADKVMMNLKIAEMNETLQHPDSNAFPKLSVSVGAAFSEHGYSSEMYSHADRALYRTKENGRCGYTLYDPEIDG